MIDWTLPMAQTFEFFEVEPTTWNDTRRLDTISAASLTWDVDADTLGSASFEIDDEVGEAYVRAYLVARQGDDMERVCLGTYMAQTMRGSFDGRVNAISADAYTPLLEMADTFPPLGYFVPSGRQRVTVARDAVEQAARAPFVYEHPDARGVLGEPFVADPSESWLAFANAVLEQGGGRLWLTPRGEVYVRADVDAASMQPVWTFRDDGKSIMLPEAERVRDLYGVPNVVEVVYSEADGTRFAKAVNDRADSMVSTVTRGREVVLRDAEPPFDSLPSADDLKTYAAERLREESCLESTVTIRHGWCGVRLGDCVRVAYERAGLDVVGIVTSQVIDCSTGCSVETTITYMEVV